MNDELMRAMGYQAEVEEVEMGICPSCKRAVLDEEFKTETDRRENKISGLCQACIDGVFG